MGQLEELREKLYGREGESVAAERRRKPPLIVGKRSQSVSTRWGEERPGAAGQENESRPRIRTWLALFAASGAVFLVGAGLFVYFYLGARHREAEITIGGRDFAGAGEEVMIPITVRNISSASLEDAALAVSIPAGTLVKTETGFAAPDTPQITTYIGTLGAGEERTQEMTVRFFGRENDQKEIKTSLLYRPEKLAARFSASASKTFAISSVPLELSWDIPPRIDPDQPIHLTLRYASRGTAPFEDAWLKIDFPPGFTVSETTPKSDAEQAYWDIGTIEPGREGTVEITGSLGGGETRSLRAGLGSFNQFTKEWKPWRESVQDIAVSQSPFLLTVRVNGIHEGVMKPGGDAELTIQYANRSKVAVKNITLRASIDSPIADLTTIVATDGGIVEAGTNAIIWGPGGTPHLGEIAAGAVGEVRARVRTRSRPIMRSGADTNLTFRVRTTVDAPDIPREFAGARLSPDDLLTLKVATIGLFSGRAVYRSSPILNTGPLPPRVGQKTTYVIMWEARNFTNAIEHAEFRARVPPAVRWVGATYPSDAAVTYDAASGEVRWRIGRLPAGTGVISPALTAAFQVSIVPSGADAHKTPLLVSEATFSGKDSFTGEDISGRIDALTTELHDDTATQQSDWIVAP